MPQFPPTPSPRRRPRARRTWRSPIPSPIHPNNVEEATGTMNRILTCLSGLLIATASVHPHPAAAWSHAGAWGGHASGGGGSWSASGARGGTASGGGGSWSGTGFRGGTASGGEGSWSGTGFRGGTASGGEGSWSGTGYRGGTA